MLYFLLVRPNLVGFLGECGVVLFCFSTLKNKNSGKWLAMAGVSLLSIIILYLTSGTSASAGSMQFQSTILHFISRAFFHTAAVFLFLRCAKTVPLRTCLLLSLLYIGGYQFSIGLRLLVSAVAFGSNELFSSLICTMTVLASQFLWGCVIRRIIRISDLEKISFSRWGVIGTLTLLQIYIRWSLMPSISGAMDVAVWFRQVEYPLIAMAGILLVEVFYEESISMQAKAGRVETEKLRLEYELKDARQQTRSADDIRRIYHDMKNHLLAIHSMDSSKQVQDYTDELLTQFNSYEQMVCTGNKVVDALLVEKSLLAGIDAIQFNVCMDLQQLDFFSAVDIVTIFGNAVDNAIEAVRKLPAEKRHIFLRSINNPGFITLVFSNPYAEIYRDKQGTLITSKGDKENHGIGLQSMKHTAERYGGIIQTNQNKEEGWFDLTILIPLSA